MRSRLQTGSTKIWTMPILPEQYDQSPLTQEEWQALEYCDSHLTANPGERNWVEYRVAKQKLDRFNRPVADVFYLRYHKHRRSGQWERRRCSDTQLFMRWQMYQRRKMFWDWLLDEWIDIICQSYQEFMSRYRGRFDTRATIMDLAYLFGGLTDLQLLGNGIAIVKGADVYFGANLVSQQCRRLLDALVEKGYNDGLKVNEQLKRCLCTLFTLNRSPYIEEISEELLAAQVAKERQPSLRGVYSRIWKALRQLDILPPGPRNEPVMGFYVDSSDMAPEWYAWCMAWFERAVDLSPTVRRQYTYTLLSIGRWLQACVPEIRTPEQWTEDLALRFRSDVCLWTIGQYGSGRGREILENKYGKIVKHTMKANAIQRYLAALKRFFTDLSKSPVRCLGRVSTQNQARFCTKGGFCLPRCLEKRNREFRTKRYQSPYLGETRHSCGYPLPERFTQRKQLSTQFLPCPGPLMGDHCASTKRDLSPEVQLCEG